MRTATTRSVAGINPGNASSSGPGYLIQRLGVGQYTVRFNPPLRNPQATAVIRASGQSASVYTAMVFNETGDSFNVYTNQSNVPADLTWGFTAVGQA